MTLILRRCPAPIVPQDLQRVYRAVILAGGKSAYLDLTWIEPGKFTMGEGAEAHEVKITKGFWIGATEVTQDQWRAVMGSSPSYFKGDANLPVEQVSWDDCQDFLTKANSEAALLDGLVLDLPTEVEWEYCCRAGSKTKWSFGDDEGQSQNYAWHRGNSEGKTHPVGEKKPNAWGLYDMHGNVWEWCKDDNGDYRGDAVDSLLAGNGALKVLRGGSFLLDPVLLRSAFQYTYHRSSRLDSYGFRVSAR